MKLFKEPDNSELSENKVSDRYCIESIYPDYQQPLSVKTKYNGTISRACYILVGLDAEINFIHTSLTDIDYLGYASADSNGFLSSLPNKVYFYQLYALIFIDAKMYL